MIIQAHHEGKCFARCCFTRRVTARMSRKDQNDLILKHQWSGGQSGKEP